MDKSQDNGNKVLSEGLGYSVMQNNSNKGAQKIREMLRDLYFSVETGNFQYSCRLKQNRFALLEA